MDMIAERAKMTKRGLYYHFKSKDELFIELFNYMNKKYYAQIPAYVTEISDPEERLMHFVKIANKVLIENTDFLKFTHEFMSIGLRKPAIREVMTSYYNDQVEKVRITIENGIQSGKFISINSEQMARAIVLVTIGAFNAYFTLDSNFDLVKQHNFNITYMLKGLINNHQS
jgi:AcrR family transcriptional regulator